MDVGLRRNTGRLLPPASTTGAATTDESGRRLVQRASWSSVACLALALIVAVSAKAALPRETVSCGEQITHSLIVGNDLDCGGDAVTIAADGVTLDLGGHLVSSQFGAAIASTGYSATTIENGGVGSAASAVVLTDAHNDTVRDIHGGSDVSMVVFKGGLHNEVIHSRLGGSLTGPNISIVGERRDSVELNTIFGNAADAIAIDHGSQNVVVGNLVEQQTVLVTGDKNDLRYNRVFSAGGSGFDVSGSRNVLANNVASGNGTFGLAADADGIKVRTPGNVLVGNVADRNAGYGIDAFPGVIDGGHNFAADNGNPAQCLNVRCLG